MPMKGKGREPIFYPVVHSMMKKAKMNRHLRPPDQGKQNCMAVLSTYETPDLTTLNESNHS